MSNILKNDIRSNSHNAASQLVLHDGFIPRAGYQLIIEGYLRAELSRSIQPGLGNQQARSSGPRLMKSPVKRTAHGRPDYGGKR
jgi:hypothetical protein